MNDPQPEGHMASHIGRRKFLATLLGGAAAAWPFSASAQQAGKIHKVGYLSPSVPNVLTPLLFDSLRELGWIEGKNVAFERRFAENRLERLPELAAELVRLNVDVIVAIGTLGPLAAKRATTTIPIVMVSAGDPLGSGLVASLARPGGNVTGMSLMVPDLGGKRLELLKELLPQLSRVAVLWNAAKSVSRYCLQRDADRRPDIGGRGSISRGAKPGRPRWCIHGSETATPRRVDYHRRPSHVHLSKAHCGLRTRQPIAVASGI